MRKKITSWLLIMALVITLIPATAATVHAASGTYEGVKYDLTGGVLTIEKGDASSISNAPAGSMGSSEMYSYSGWKRYSSEVTKIVIKDGVTDIAKMAFSGMSNLTEVEIADSVKKIGDDAFYNDPLLTDVELGNSTESIGREAFMYCTELADIDLPTSIRWVGVNAFKETAIFNAQSEADYIIVDSVLLGTNKYSFYAEDPCVIPEGITCIADEAFMDVVISGSLTFPDSLLYIGNYSFDGGHYNLSHCDKTLLELDLNNVVQIGNGSFRYWYCIDEVDLSKVTYVGDYAFYWCHDLHTLKFAPTMEYLGEYVISASDNVATVYGPEYVERASGYAFMGQSPFSKSIYGDADGDGMMYYNGILAAVTVKGNEITIADGTYNIGSRAFEQYYSSDSSTISVTIPKSVTSIGYSATLYSVTDVYYAGSMNDWNAINFENENTFPNATIHCAESDAVKIEDCTVKVAYAATTYTGQAKTPAVTVTAPDGKTLARGTDYKLDYTNNVNAGTATVTITGQGEYAGTVEKAFTIKKVTADKVTIKLEYQKTNYDGQQKTPAVTLTDSNGRVLINDTDYTVEYPGTLGTGRYTVTATLMGNYTGEKTAQFTIVPYGTSTVLVNLNGPTSVQVVWDLVPQASGYYVYFKKASASTWSKAVDCGKTRKWTKTGLAAGTQYNFKVVPYWKASDGTKYTSNTPVQKNIYTLKAAGPVTVKKSAAGKVKVTWKNINGESGYQVQKMIKKSNVYIASASMKKGVNVTSAVFAHAKGKQFYYRVRAYKTEKINGATKTVYGPWTAVKGFKMQ